MGLSSGSSRGGHVGLPGAMVGWADAPLLVGATGEVLVYPVRHGFGLAVWCATMTARSGSSNGPVRPGESDGPVRGEQPLRTHPERDPEF